jgi:hypothetical protein
MSGPALSLYAEVTTVYNKAVTSRTMPPVTGRDAVRGTSNESGPAAHTKSELLPAIGTVECRHLLDRELSRLVIRVFGMMSLWLFLGSSSVIS